MRRGDIHELRPPRRAGHELQGRRFGVVVQADALLSRSVVLVAPTSRSALAAATAVRGKLRAAEMGGIEPQVSERLAQALAEIVGGGEPKGKWARIGRSLWVVQRGWNFWNITKHSANVWALAAQRAWGEATRAIMTGRPQAAAGEARLALGPLSFL
ncbi:MAG: type II toxin-antitoxin system PemK/MazF family toxin, partial [Acidimicrobiales bacterium]